MAPTEVVHAGNVEPEALAYFSSPYSKQNLGRLSLPDAQGHDILATMFSAPYSRLTQLQVPHLIVPAQAIPHLLSCQQLQDLECADFDLPAQDFSQQPCSWRNLTLHARLDTDPLALLPLQHLKTMTLCSDTDSKFTVRLSGNAARNQRLAAQVAHMGGLRWVWHPRVGPDPSETIIRVYTAQPNSNDPSDGAVTGAALFRLLSSYTLPPTQPQSGTDTESDTDSESDIGREFVRMFGTRAQVHTGTHTALQVPVNDGKDLPGLIQHLSKVPDIATQHPDHTWHLRLQCWDVEIDGYSQEQRLAAWRGVLPALHQFLTVTVDVSEAYVNWQDDNELTALFEGTPRPKGVLCHYHDEHLDSTLRMLDVAAKIGDRCSQPQLRSRCEDILDFYSGPEEYESHLNHQQNTAHWFLRSWGAGDTVPEAGTYDELAGKCWFGYTPMYEAG